DEGLRYTDGVLEELFGNLRALGALENALVIVTSDHGEEFAEHGGLIHRDTLYEELLHVPLIAAGTGSVRLGPPRVKSALVGAYSLGPTPVSMGGFSPPAWMEGPVILPAVKGAKQGPVFAQYGGRRFSVREDEVKLIENVEPLRIELYD